MSEETKKKMAEAQRKRWAAYRKGKHSLTGFGKNGGDVRRSSFLDLSVREPIVGLRVKACPYWCAVATS